MKKKIVIVEDESIIAMELEERLNQMGFAVAGTFSRGDTVITKISGLRPDLILVDINIQGSMNGIETARKIKDTYNIPFIYITANNDEETLQRAKQTNPDGFLVKPFHGTELKTVIEKALKKI